MLPKTANKYFRWNLLFTFIVFSELTFPFWFPLIPVLNRATFEVVLGLLTLFQLVWLTASFQAVKIVQRLRKHKRLADESHDLESQATICGIKHLVGICLYKEPLNLIFTTVDSMARQKNATEKICVIVGLEEGTPDREQKALKLQTRYHSSFERFMVTVHPRNVPGELPGKCSNFNYAMRQAVASLRSDPSYDIIKNDILVTTGDCDTVFPCDYIQTLEKDYIALTPSERLRAVWQSPVFYQMGIENSPFFVRVTGLLRSFFMIGILIPWNINTMSAFSLSLDLYENGGCTHPGYQMDDIIAMIRWSLNTRKFCKIRLLEVVTMSGPTSGRNYIEEFVEWARQIQRWTIGAGEVFHYFMVKARRISVRAAFSWAIKFISYYGVLLCVAPIFSIVAPIACIMTMNITGTPLEGLLIPNVQVFNWILLGLLVFQYFWFAIVFWVNISAEIAFPDNIKDKTGPIFSFVHWILTLPTILGYCCVELWGFVLLTVRGKSVCQHKASKKDALSSVVAVVK